MQIFFQSISTKADNRIDDYIRRCIKYLAAMNCVIYNETHMIGVMPTTAEIEMDISLLSKRRSEKLQMMK